MTKVLENAKEIMRNTFEGNRHAPNQVQLKALDDLLVHLDRMAKGKLKPHYYVSALDPGVGKTTALISYLRALVEDDESQAVGVIVGFYRKAEIEAIVRAAELPKHKFAVLTSEEALNELGSSVSDTAQVVFTTQQREELFWQKKQFSEISTFSYRGHPRTVRVWDEGFKPSHAICLSRDKLMACIDVIRHPFPPQAAKLDELMKDIVTKADGEVVQLETMYSAFSFDLETLITQGRSLDASALGVLKELRMAGGQKAIIRKHADSRPHFIISYADNHPSDLAPLIILDASARVRYSYRLWRQSRGGLRFLKTASKSYDALCVHLWERGAGRSSIANNPELFADAIASTILTNRPHQKWLVVIYKQNPNEHDLEALVRARLDERASGRVAFLTWGRHTATNEFANYSNVILTGSLYLSDEVLEAEYRAAGNVGADIEVSGSDRDKFARGEMLHHALQAACRSGIRRGTEAGGRSFHLYIASARRHGLRDWLGKAFPGCQVKDWTPVEDPLVGRQKELVDYIVANLSRLPGAVLRFSDIRRAMGIGSSQQLRALRQHPRVRQALEKLGIAEYSPNERGLGYYYKSAQLPIEDK